jgi:hypothetical protein
MKKLKFILLIIIGLFLLSCTDRVSSSSSSESTSSSNDGSTDTSPGNPAPSPESNDGDSVIVLSILTDDAIYFYDGELNDASHDTPKACGFRCFTDGQEKVFYGDDGEPIAFEWLDNPFDFVAGDWTVEKIDPQTALGLGAQARHYTRVYYQGTESGNWFLNQWETTGLFETISGDVIAIDQNQSFRPVSANISNINSAGDLLVYDFDGIGRTAMIDDGSTTFVSWTTNSFNNADQWLKSGDIWYSWNGYEFQTSLTEYANSMFGWNNGNEPVETEESAVVIAAGVRDSVLYWIECNSGWLIKYTPSNDQLAPSHRLYMGDGFRITGIAHKNELKPVTIGDFLYFHESGSIWKLNLDSGVVQLFFAGSGEVEGW